MGLFGHIKDYEVAEMKAMAEALVETSKRSIRATTAPDGTLLITSIPSIGDKIKVEGYGDAEVCKLYHSAINNFIVIKFHNGVLAKHIGVEQTFKVRLMMGNDIRCAVSSR